MTGSSPFYSRSRCQRYALSLWGLLCPLSLSFNGGMFFVDAKNPRMAQASRNLLEWVLQTPGAYISPAQVLSQDGASLIANQRIPQGTILATIPYEIILVAEMPENGLSCEMIERLEEEMMLGKKSEFAPLLEYFQAAQHHFFPSNWSQEGKRLLQEITLNGRLPPSEATDWLDLDFYDLCRGSSVNDALAMWTIQWAPEGEIAPLVSGVLYSLQGKVNNRANAETITKINESLQVVATQDIEIGEPITISQYNCSECEFRAQGYGTPEILREYGYVESMPQRWHYMDGEIQFFLDKNDTHYKLDIEYPWQPDKLEEYGQLGVWLRRMMREVQKVRGLSYRDGKPYDMPEEEWKTAWEFADAHLLAMTLAVKALDIQAPESKNPQAELAWKISEVQPPTTHYHTFDWEFDHINYRDETCNNDDALRFVKHRSVEDVTTPYQKMSFYIEPGTGDVVLELDKIIQIASIYRPQYHEYAVHAAARFIESLKRVIFIGGGDSMLLHEVLKYPDLELVVGLELDQMVTRKSFQYFQTQPHFGDPRVEWWFGDATKSLLLLTKEYWQSFDLVLVDLSETVMSLSVTEELNVFDALALLLKPEGVLVKNELYKEQVSEVFDYTIEINYESPILCDQVMIMGSNKVDFMRAPLYDHKVPTLLYEPMTTPQLRTQFMHDFRHNDALAAGKCDAPPSCKIPTAEQSKSAGIMEILDVEGVTIPLDDSFVQLFETAIDQHDFELVTSPILLNDLLVLVMQEGYIAARKWPSRKYCSIDINIWGNFDKLKPLRESILNAFKGSEASNFRVVVGGMFGSATWTKDREDIGPRIVQIRDCSERELREVEGLPSGDELVLATVENTMEHVMQVEKASAVAICGPVEETCASVDWLKKSSKISKIIRLSACPDLSTPDKMYDCELELAKEWRFGMASNPANFLIVDESASYEMLQLIDSMLTETTFLKSVIAPINVAIAWSTDPMLEPWRKMFMEYCRRHYMDDPLFRGELSINFGKESAIAFDILTFGDVTGAYALQRLEESLRERFSETPSDALDISLEMIHGGKYEFINPWNPKTFLQSDYDNEPGLDQYYNQQPLAYHVVFQLEPSSSSKTRFEISQESLHKALAAALQEVNFGCTYEATYKGLGEGLVSICLNTFLGSVVLVWDGRSHIDISYYRIGATSRDVADKFKIRFVLAVYSELAVTLQDEMARGTGRALNPVWDLRTPEQVKALHDALRAAPSFSDQHITT